MKKYLTIERLEIISFLCICVTILGSLRQIDFLLIPSFLLVLLWIVQYRNIDKCNIDVVDIVLIFLLICEVGNYLFSSYRANSYFFLRDFIVLFQLVCILKQLLKQGRYQILIALFVSLVALISSNIGFRQFLYKYFEANYYAFSDYLAFRYLNSPLGFTSNEWGTIMLTFIPFLFLALINLTKKNSESIYFSNSRVVIFALILAITYVILNSLVLFSRGIYLAILVYILTFNLLAVLYKVKLKKFIFLKNLLLFTIFLGGVLFFHSTISSMIGTNISLERSSNGRVEQWNSTVDIVKNYPLLGVGSKNYTLINNTFRKENQDTFFTGRVNNTFVQILIEKGLIGSAMYLTLLLIFMYYSHRKIVSSINEEKCLHIIILSSVIAILVRELFFSSILYNSGLLLLVFILFTINTSGSKVIFVLSNRQARWILLFIIPFVIILINKDISFRNEKEQLGNLTKLIDDNKYNAALKFTVRVKPERSNNSLIVSTCGLIYERNAIDSLSNYKSVYSFKYKNFKLIESAKTYYINSINLNSFEDVYYHNLSWLYFKSGQIDSANTCIQKAIEIMPNYFLYYVSNGIFLEKYNLNKAINNYKKAIELSPDITNSCFFDEMILRLSLNKNKLIENAIVDLRESQEKRYSTIIQARLGKLLLDIDSLDAAKSVFTKVLNELPNLGRPWYYLGYIHEMEGDYPAMLSCYKKAIFLDYNDYLPRQRLASYYKSKGEIINTEYYSKTALKSFQNKVSESSIKSGRKYFQNVARNDLIPYNIIDELKPKQPK